jgi:hypothetical protein
VRFLSLTPYPALDAGRWTIIATLHSSLHDSRAILYPAWVVMSQTAGHSEGFPGQDGQLSRHHPLYLAKK